MGYCVGRPVQRAAAARVNSWVGWRAHAGIVQHQITDIDEMAVEQQRPHRLGHVAARLPTGGKP